MSDLFDRLIERAHGGSAVIRPRPASVFETDGAMPAIDPLTVEAGDTLHAPRQFDAAAPVATAPGRHLSPAPRAFGPPPRLLTPTGDDIASPHPNNDGSLEPLRPMRLMPPIKTPANGLTAFREEPFPSGQQAIASSPEPELVERRSPSPIPPVSQVRTPNRRELDIDVESSDRTVTISIGRIDIQAVPPAPAIPRANRSTPPRHLTLEDYVRQRNEGAR